MLYVLALHIIFVVTWFAGLFYIVRLFVYHSESFDKKEPDRTILMNHFKIAEKRLWFGITWPSAVLTIITGTWLIISLYSAGIPGWLYLKLAFVVCLLIYHLICHSMFRKYQRSEINYTGMQMRMWNELATIFLIAIVFIVVLKDLSNWLKGFIGLIILSAALFAAIKIYKKIRERN